MTDLATDLGGTRTCPNCGEQVSVPQDHLDPVPCPKCGAAVLPGPPPYEEDGEQTLDEALRSVAAAGHDGEVALVGTDEVRCTTCGATVPLGRLAIRSLHLTTDAAAGGRSVTVAAVRCPNCGAAGRLELPHDADDGRTALAALGVPLEDR